MSLQVWLPLDGNLNNHGIASITAINNNAIINNAGKIGKCYSFNGTDARIDTGFGNGISSKNISITLWVKLNAVTNDKMICGVSNGSNQRLYVGIKNSTYNLGYGNSNWGRTSNAPAVADVWSHLAITVDNNGKASLYQNGILTNETLTYATNFNFISNFYIGGRPDGYYSNCLINDFRIYNNCLSAEEVKKIAQGLVRHYTFAEWPQKNLLSGDVNKIASWTTENSNTTQEDNIIRIVFSGSGNNRIYNNLTNIWKANTDYVVSFDCKANTNGSVLEASRSLIANNNCTFTLTPEWQHYSGIIHSTDTVPGGTLSLRMLAPKLNDTIWIKNIKLELGTLGTSFVLPLDTDLNTTTIINDISGFYKNLTKHGSTITFVEGNRYPVAFSLTANDWLSAESLPVETKTITFWYKGNPTTANHILFIDKDSGLALGFYSNGQKFITNTSSNTVKIISNWKNNDWNFIALIKSPSVTNIYINTQLCQADTATNNWGLNNTSGLQINGRANSASDSKPMIISDFRAYSTELSANEIKELYDMGKTS